MLAHVLAAEFGAGGERASEEVEKRVFAAATSGATRLPPRGDPSPAAALAAIAEGLWAVADTIIGCINLYGAWTDDG